MHASNLVGRHVFGGKRPVVVLVLCHTSTCILLQAWTAAMLQGWRTSYQESMCRPHVVLGVQGLTAAMLQGWLTSCQAWLQLE